MNPVTDVVIVGAGITGTCAAFHLARMGKRVTVIEKGSIASGMTKRSGGLVHAFFSDQPTARLALHSLLTYQNWKTAVGGDCGYKACGLIIPVQGEASESRLSKIGAMLEGVGTKVHLLSAEQVHEVEPGASTDGITRAAHEPDAGFIDPVAATQSLAARGKDLGVKFQTGTLARSIRTERNRVLAVETNAGAILTSDVVVMAGPWSDRLLKPLGVDIGIKIERHQVAFFDRPEDLKKGHTAFLDIAAGAYFRPHTYGLTLGGLIGARAEEAMTADQLDESVSQEFITQIKEKIASRLPSMGNAKFLRGHAGYYDSTTDAHPVLGKAPGFSGLYIAAGFGGIGLCMAPAVGIGIAELIVDGEARSVDLKPFRSTRFKEGQAFTNEALWRGEMQ